MTTDLAPEVLLLPGWQNSGPDHWQSRWERLHGHRRVDQHDWLTPRRGDWLARLDEVVVDSPRPLVLVAHSLGCILTAAWAHHSRHTGRVCGALLVAPGDVEQPDLAPALPGWAPIVRHRLPFPSVLVASRNDPYCHHDRAVQLARDWGSRLVDLGPAGHVERRIRAGRLARGPGLAEPVAGPPPPGHRHPAPLTARDPTGDSDHMATKKPKGLGRGLEALLGPKLEDTAAEAGSGTDVPSTLALNDLVPGTYQPAPAWTKGALRAITDCP